MRDWSSLRDARVVRLNADLFPPSDYETSLFEHYQIRPILTEANTPQDILPWVADCDALFAISVALPAAVVDGLARCRVISRLGTGTDKIAVDRASARGILVTNVPYFCVEEQADHTLALLLSLARQIAWALGIIQREDDIPYPAFAAELPAKTDPTRRAEEAKNIALFEKWRDEKFAPQRLTWAEKWQRDKPKFELPLLLPSGQNKVIGLDLKNSLESISNYDAAEFRKLLEEVRKKSEPGASAP